MTNFKAKYEIDDGYVGGSAPQYFRINAEDVEEDMTEADLESLFYELADEHMRSHIGIHKVNLSDFKAWAEGIIAARKAVEE